MNHLLRSFRRLLASGTAEPSCANVFETQRRAFARAQLIVCSFYAGNLLWAGWQLAQHQRWREHDSLVPLWPLYWAESLDVGTVVTFVLLANVLTAVLAVLIPTSGVARWLAFAGVLVTGALSNSFGRIGHSGHIWVWVAFFFALLPSASQTVFASSRLCRQRYLQMFWMAQFAILFFYSIAGGLKVASAPVQWLNGEVGAFAPEALARHVANRMIQTESEPLLGRWLVEHLVASWPLYLGALYLEAFAVLVAFRPVLHRLWGAGLILMHLGIGVGMEIWFVRPLFILALLLVNSPFQPATVSWQQALRELPGLYAIFQIRRYHFRRRMAARIVPSQDQEPDDLAAIGIGDHRQRGGGSDPYAEDHHDLAAEDRSDRKARASHF